MASRESPPLQGQTDAFFAEPSEQPRALQPNPRRLSSKRLSIALLFCRDSDRMPLLCKTGKHSANRYEHLEQVWLHRVRRTFSKFVGYSETKPKRLPFGMTVRKQDGQGNMSLRSTLR